LRGHQQPIDLFSGGSRVAFHILTEGVHGTSTPPAQSLPLPAICPACLCPPKLLAPAQHLPCHTSGKHSNGHDSLQPSRSLDLRLAIPWRVVNTPPSRYRVTPIQPLASEDGPTVKRWPYNGTHRYTGMVSHPADQLEAVEGLHEGGYLGLPARRHSSRRSLQGRADSGTGGQERDAGDRRECLRGPAGLHREQTPGAQRPAT
jgi:hypothetical protein